MFAATVSFAPLQLAPATISGILYAIRVQHLERAGRPVPGWRQACFYGGLLLIVATLTALGDIAGESFPAHMLEHLLLGDIGTLLLVLGLTGPILAPVLRIRWIAPLKVLAHPCVALPLWAIDLYLWHLPSLHDAAVEHSGVHALQHMSFIAFGVAMWMPLFGPLPMPAWFGNLAKLGYIILVRFIGAVLGNVLVFSSSVFYPVYGEGVSSQSTAGAIMMVESSLLTLCLFCWLFLKTASESQERQELIELAQAQGMEVTPERIKRAVSAGRGAELRHRIESGSLAAPLPTGGAAPQEA